MQPELKSDRRPGWQVLLALLAGLCVVVSLSIYYLSNLSGLVYQMLIAPLAFMGAGLVLFASDACRHGAGKLLMGVFLWVFLSIVLNEKFYGSMLDNRSYIDSLAIQLFVCFPLGYVLAGGQRQRFLTGLMRLSIFLVACACIIGLYAAFTGQYWEPWANMNYGIGIYPKMDGDGSLHRLTILCHSNSVGIIAGLTLLISLYRVIVSRHFIEKLLCGLAGVCLYLAVALSVSRTAMLAVSAGAGLFALRWMLIKLKGVKKRAAVSLSILGAAAVILVCFFLFTPVTRISNSIISSAPSDYSPASSQQTDSASAPAEEESAIMQRPMIDPGLFSGRPYIWKTAISTFGSNPRLWLFGYSPSEVGNQVGPLINIWTTQMHSSFVQVLIASGLPALLAFLGFLVLLMISCLRQYFRLSAEDGGAGYLPAILFPICLFAFMESFLIIYPDPYFAGLWFFVLAGYLCSTNDNKLLAP